MDIQEKTRATWDKRWKGSENKERITFIGNMMFSAKQRAIKKVLDKIKIKNMLEVGSGLGYTLSVFSSAGVDAQGIDISEYAVAVCKKKGLNVRLERLEDVREKFELVSSDGLLEHFEEFRPYALDMMRASSKYLLLIQPDHGSIIGRLAVFLADLLRGRENVKEYDHPISSFIKIFQENGFILNENMPIFGGVFRLLLFKKYY
jgi:SAM-dependent methyltransferase